MPTYEQNVIVRLIEEGVTATIRKVEKVTASFEGLSRHIGEANAISHAGVAGLNDTLSSVGESILKTKKAMGIVRDVTSETTKKQYAFMSGFELMSRKMGESAAVSIFGANAINDAFTTIGESTMSNKKAMGILASAYGKQNIATKILAYSHRRLTSALLSTMFFGFALSRVMGGLLGPITDVSGVTEEWRGTLLSVTSKAFEPFRKGLSSIMAGLRKLDPTTASIITKFAIFAGIFAALTAAFAVIVLPLTAVAGALVLPALAIGLIIAAIALLIQRFIEFKGENYSTVDAIKLAFGPLTGFFEGIAKTVSAVFDGIKTTVSDALGVIKSILVVPISLVGLFTGTETISGVFEKVKTAVQTVWDFVKKAVDFLKDPFGLFEKKVEIPSLPKTLEIPIGMGIGPTQEAHSLNPFKVTPEMISKGGTISTTNISVGTITFQPIQGNSLADMIQSAVRSVVGAMFT